MRLWGREVRVFPPFPAKGFFRHGWQSWSLAAWVDPAQAPTPLLPEARRPQADDPFLLEAGAWWGSGVGALRGPDGRALLLGALDLGARVLGREDLLLGRYAGKGGAWFLAYGPEEEVFAAYARLLPRRLSGRPPGCGAPGTASTRGLARTSFFGFWTRWRPSPLRSSR